MLTLWTDFRGLRNERDAVGEWARRDVDEPEGKVAVSLWLARDPRILLAVPSTREVA